VSSRKEALLFLKKKKQKDFLSCGRWRVVAKTRRSGSFFGYFFFKKSNFSLFASSTLIPT